VRHHTKSPSRRPPPCGYPWPAGSRARLQPGRAVDAVATGSGACRSLRVIHSPSLRPFFHARGARIRERTHALTEPSIHWSTAGSHSLRAKVARAKVARAKVARASSHSERTQVMCDRRVQRAGIFSGRRRSSYDICMHACMHACMYSCMHACMYVCMYASCMYVCMYVCMYALMYVCMHVCTYVCR
jgi:hypothetical protein